MLPRIRATLRIDESIHRRPDELLDLGERFSVHGKIAAKRVADLGVWSGLAGVFAEQKSLAGPTQFLDPYAMMASHRQYEIRFLDKIPC